MKKFFSGIVVLSIVLFISSCTSNNATAPVGAWTFKSVTYTPTSSRPDSIRLVSIAPGSNLTLTFPGTVLPGVSTSYWATNTTPAYNQTLVELTIGTATYRPAASALGKEVIVTVSSLNSRLEVSGGPMTMVNTTNPADSATFSYVVDQNR